MLYVACMCAAAATLQAVRKLMRDHGKEDASPKEEFMALLASGALSPAMHQFLTSTLGAVRHHCACNSLQCLAGLLYTAVCHCPLAEVCQQPDI